MPHFLAWRLREYGYSAQLIDAAHEVNAHMPNFVLQKVGDALNDIGRPIKGSRILLLGVAYKADVADTRESPCSRSSSSSSPAAATCATATPTSPPWTSTASPTPACSGRRRRSTRRDCVVMLTAAPRVPRAALWDRATVVVDTRNVVPAAPNVVRI